MTGGEDSQDEFKSHFFKTDGDRELTRVGVDYAVGSGVAKAETKAVTSTLKNRKFFTKNFTAIIAP